MKRNSLYLAGGVVLVLAIAIAFAGCISFPGTTTSDRVPGVDNPTTRPTSDTIPPTTWTTRSTVPTPPPTTASTVLFSDDLSAWQSSWDQEYDGPSGRVFYSGGKLHIKDYKPPEGTVYHTLNRDFSNFVLDVDMETISGTLDNWGGVMIRGHGEDNYYWVGVSSDGYYGLSLWKNGVRTALAGPTRSSDIHTGIGGTNHLRVEADGSKLSLTVNGEPIKTVYDSAFTSGDVSLGVNALPSNSNAEIAFSNLRITSV